MDQATESRMKEMEQMIANGQFSEMENVWLEAAPSAADDESPFLKLAHRMSKLSQGPKASMLLEMLIEPLIDAGRPDAACEVVNTAAELDPTNTGLKDSARRAYTARFSSVPGFEEVLTTTERDLAHSAGAFVNGLRELCSFRIGDYLFHDAGWGLGKVVGLDLLNRRMTIDFSESKGHEVDLAAATQYFRKLPNDHLLVRKDRDISEIKAEADAHPVGVIRCAMKSLEGKVTLRRLKDALSPDVIGKAAWSKWWSKVKADMTAKGMLRVSGTAATASVELLHIPSTLEDEFSTRLAAAHTPVAFARVLMEYTARDDGSPEHRTRFLNTQLRALFDLIQSAETYSDGEKLLGKMVLDLVRESDPDVENMYELDVREIAADSNRSLAAVERIGLPVFERAFLEQVREANKEWPTVFAESLLRRAPQSWTWIAKELREYGEEAALHAACRIIHAHAHKPFATTVTEPGPDGEPWTHEVQRTYPSQFLWLAGLMICEGTPEDYGLGAMTKGQAFNEVLRLGMDIFHRVERGDRGAKPLVHEFRGALAERNCRMVRTVLDGSTIDDARHLMHAIQINRALSEARVESLLGFIFEVHAELRQAAEVAPGAGGEETGEVLATPIGIQKKRQERERIINTELPATQKAIGEALQLGDISENAELDAARAKEELLNSRLAELNRELNRARIVAPSEVDPTRVGFGTTVSVKNTATGADSTYTILGRWDANMAQGIISDISAIAKGLAGAHIGDRRAIVTPDGTVNLEVTSIARASFDN